MTTDEIIEEYKNAYFTTHAKFPEVTKKGSWIHINKMAPCRARDLIQLTENLLSIFDHLDTIPSKKEEYSEIECLMNIKKEAKFIFGSTDVKKMQLSAKKIVKMVTTLMNIQEKE